MEVSVFIFTNWTWKVTAMDLVAIFNWTLILEWAVLTLIPAYTNRMIYNQRWSNSKWRQKCLLAISLTGGLVCLVLEGLGWIVPMVDNWKKWVAVNSLSVYLLQKQDLPMMVWSLKLYWFTVSEPKNMGHILLWKINGRVRIIWEKCFGARNIVVCRCQFSGRMICSWKAIKKLFSPSCLLLVVFFSSFLGVFCLFGQKLADLRICFPQNIKKTYISENYLFPWYALQFYLPCSFNYPKIWLTVWPILRYVLQFYLHT